MTVINHPVTDYATVVDSSTQFLDVREPAEVVEGTLPGTINIPLGQLPNRLAELDPTRRVVVLCRSGGRSAHAAKMLIDIGFTDVVNLDGGMLAFSARG
jgi:rhodanese-related sulfurtransferase